jgi:molybdopterin/thiamine biosynthesis adenylyltransferase
VDATNLNRQLLFNKSNVGQSKAYAARDTSKLIKCLSTRTSVQKKKKNEQSSDYVQL